MYSSWLLSIPLYCKYISASSPFWLCLWDNPLNLVLTHHPICVWHPSSSDTHPMFTWHRPQAWQLPEHHGGGSSSPPGSKDENTKYKYVSNWKSRQFATYEYSTEDGSPTNSWNLSNRGKLSAAPVVLAAIFISSLASMESGCLVILSKTQFSSDDLLVWCLTI